MFQQRLVVDQEFHVLGQQKLTELRDKIVCMADHIAVGEFSENPNQEADILTKVSIAAFHGSVSVMPTMRPVHELLSGWPWFNSWSYRIIDVRIIGAHALRLISWTDGRV